MLFSTGFYAILVDRQKDCIKLYVVNQKRIQNGYLQIKR